MIFLCSCFKNIEKINKYIINESHVEGEGLKYSERGGDPLSVFESFKC